jgi:hypothetical protein
MFETYICTKYFETELETPETGEFFYEEIESDTEWEIIETLKNEVFIQNVNTFQFAWIKNEMFYKYFKKKGEL